MHVKRATCDDGSYSGGVKEPVVPLNDGDMYYTIHIRIYIHTFIITVCLMMKLLCKVCVCVCLYHSIVGQSWAPHGAAF